MQISVFHCSMYIVQLILDAFGYAQGSVRAPEASHCSHSPPSSSYTRTTADVRLIAE